jgi:hypothetical protein
MEIIEITTPEIVVVNDTEIEILEVAAQGAPGIQGIPGVSGGLTLQYIAGYALGGHRMVVLNSASAAIYADNSIPAHASKVLGITTGAASLGAMATIQTGGEMEEPAWNWVLDTPVWLSSNGLLTQFAPVTGFSQIIGFPITATKLFINLREPITLN